MADLLTPEELAYLRETQALARPTQAELFARTESVSDGMGGRTTANATEGTPIQVRITQVADSTSDDDVPSDLASRYAASDLVRITTDLVAIGVGDRIHDAERGRWYDVVSNADPQEWTTAQSVWAARGTGP